MRGLCGKLPSLFFPLSLPLHFCSWAKNLQDPLLDPVHALLQPLSSAWYQSQLCICEVSRPPQSGVGRLEEPGCLHHSESLSAAHICQERSPVLLANGSPLYLLAPEGAHYPFILISCTTLHWGSIQRPLSSATPCPSLPTPSPSHTGHLKHSRAPMS